MNISKLNPFSYTAKTENGNEYKATRRNALLLGGSALATEIAYMQIPHIKNNTVKGILKTFSAGQALKDTVETISKKQLTPKKAMGIAIIGSSLGILLDTWFGKWLDKRANAKRAEKADRLAEEKASIDEEMNSQEI